MVHLASSKTLLHTVPGKLVESSPLTFHETPRKDETDKENAPLLDGRVAEKPGDASSKPPVKACRVNDLTVHLDDVSCFF